MLLTSPFSGRAFWKDQMKKNYLSFDDVVTEYPFSKGTLRRLLFNRYRNGLSKAVLQRERILIFYRPAFEKWIRAYFSAGAGKTPASSRE